MLVIPNRGNNLSDLDLLLSEINIIHAERDFYVLVPKDFKMEDYKDRPVKTTVVQINKSLTNSPENYEYMMSNNSKIVQKNIYIYSVTFHKGLNNINEAEFSLTNASSTFTYTDHDRKLSNSSPSSYYTDKLVNDPECSDIFSDYSSSSVPLTDPRYYNSKHAVVSMEKDNNMIMDVFNIMWSTQRFHYFGKELMDEKTSIKFRNINKFDKISNSFDFDDNEVVDHMLDFITRLCLTINETMISDAIFIYDTDLGYNVKGGNIPYQNILYRDYVIGRLTLIQRSIANIAKDIEDNYGPIRLMYNPSDIGDFVSIIVKKNRNLDRSGIFFDKNTIFNSFIFELFDSFENFKIQEGFYR